MYFNVITPTISGDSGSPTTIFRPSKNKSYILSGILLANTHTEDVTASIFIREELVNGTGVGNDVHFAKDVTVPANTTVELLQGEYPIGYLSGVKYYDTILGYCSVENGVDLILSMKRVEG